MNGDEEEWEEETEEFEEEGEGMETETIIMAEETGGAYEIYARPADVLCITFRTIANVIGSISSGFHMAANLAGMHANKGRSVEEERRVAEQFDSDVRKMLGGPHG